jgi:K+-transporting ATPase ATPase C chain
MKTLFISLKIFFFFTVLTGIVYPLFVTAMAQLVFPDKANGSLIIKDNKLAGSELIGQQFVGDIYFSSRPSAISYNPLPSGGSNFGLTNAKLKHSVDSLKNQFIVFNQLDINTKIPSEMLFASASGLDPHISQKAALLQVERISKVRHFESDRRQLLLQCVKEMTEAPQYLCLGQERVNVLKLNIALDKISGTDIINKTNK